MTGCTNEPLCQPEGPVRALRRLLHGLVECDELRGLHLSVTPAELNAGGGRPQPMTVRLEFAVAAPPVVTLRHDPAAPPDTDLEAMAQAMREYRGLAEPRPFREDLGANVRRAADPMT